MKMTDAPTDVLGNLTPSGMVASQNGGVPTLPIPAAIPQQSEDTDQAEPQAPAPGSFAQRLAQAADTLAIPTGPGGWSKNLVAANLHAISGQPIDAVQPAASAGPGGWRGAVGNIARVGNGLMSSLGDAAAAGEPAPGGGGALTGIARTLNARSQRIAGEKEAMSKEQSAELLRAETTQRIAMNTRNMYRQDAADRKTEQDQGKSFMGNLRTRYNTSDDQDNITQDQLNDMMSKDPNFWKTHTGRPTGEQPVYRDGKPALHADGTPVTEPTYSISKTDNTERTHPISESEAKYISDNTGVNVPANTPLALSQYDNLLARADGARATRTRIEKANDEDMSAEQARQLNEVLNDPQIQHYIAVDPVGGLTEARKNADAHLSAIDQMIAAVEKKNPSQPGQPNPTTQMLQQKKQELTTEAQKIDKAMSALTPAAKENYEKKIEEDRKQTEIERHNRAEEAVKQAENPNNAANSIPVTPEVQQKISTLSPASQAILGQYDSNTQSSLMAIAFGNGEQDLEKNFPSRLTKGAPGLNTQQALGVIHQLNPSWSEQSYEVKKGMYKSATVGKLSQQSDSLNNFIGHAAEARRVADKFWNADPKLFKSTVNAVSKAGYGTDAVSLGEAISVVNGEFDNMVKSGYAPTQDEVQAQSTLVNANSTVGQINAALKVMAHMATTRAITMDGHYKTATGDHFPNLINEDNQDDARTLGIPVEKFYTGGRIGGSGNASQQQNTQTGTPGKAANQQATPQVPVGAIGQGKGSDGKMYYVDINHKPLALVPGQ
jgi:hypothetical protein